MQTLLQDILYCARTLLKMPGFTDLFEQVFIFDPIDIMESHNRVGRQLRDDFIVI
jgi:hypothetical protein